MPVAVFCMFFTSQEINTKRSPNASKLFVNFFGPEDVQWVGEAPGGCSEGSTTHQGTPGGPGALVGCAHLGCLPNRLFTL